MYLWKRVCCCHEKMEKETNNETFYCNNVQSFKVFTCHLTRFDEILLLLSAADDIVIRMCSLKDDYRFMLLQ